MSLTTTQTPLSVLDDPNTFFYFNAPPLALYNLGNDVTATPSDTKVVEQNNLTVMWDYQAASGDTPEKGPTFIQAIFTFSLLSALLDSAPTGDKPSLFLVGVFLPDGVGAGSNWTVDAQIQTKGNSAMSPTYTTSVSEYSTGSGTSTAKKNGIIFPVTNFFNVSSPGAPYTITLTLQKSRPK